MPFAVKSTVTKPETRTIMESTSEIPADSAKIGTVRRLAFTEYFQRDNPVPTDLENQAI